MTALCPTHDTPLTGGPTQFHCWAGDGHSVRAADLDHEYHPEPVQEAS